ncbi:hypothetical protein DL96DRAFT_508426 [Flagelloscypha sp. PMI_526]|nr:hypothetical protein DL96DRAFT_508426 [Flagelloscypha sp. PMI_526]
MLTVLVFLPLTGSYIWGYGVGPCIIVIHWFIFITRIWNFIMKPPTSRWQRFDLMNSKENTKHAPRVSLILGRNAWTKLSLKGEHRAVKYTRAVLAIAVMGTLVIFASLLIQRAIDTSAHESAFNDFTELYDYSQVLDTPRIYLLHLTTLDHYPSIVASRANITHRCWEGVGGPEVTAKCEVDSNPEYVGSVLCSADLSGDTSPSTATESSRLPCETRVEFDFAVFDSLPLVQEIFRVVTIHIVGVNTTRAEISSLPHVTLRKHDNFVGDAEVIIRENFKSTTGLNAFGYGGSYKRINAAEFPQLRVDELYIKGSISSLRFFTVAPSFEESAKLTLKIMREYNDHSILDIFADLGGIWTFVNGMFALIFGGSLLYFLFGIKPLSRFGIAHFIFRERLRRGTRENYPRFFEEGGQPGQQDAGVIAFIREHLLGVISDDLPTQPYTSSNSPTALNPAMANTGSGQALGSDLTLLSRLERSEGETMERIPLEPMRYTS